MTTLTLIHMLSTLVALSVALSAIVVSMRFRSTAVIRRLRMQLTELESEHDKLVQWYKKLNANYALIVAREKASEKKQEVQVDAFEPNGFDQLPDETPAHWKQRIRRALSSGHLKPPK